VAHGQRKKQLDFATNPERVTLGLGLQLRTRVGLVTD